MTQNIAVFAAAVTALAIATPAHAAPVLSFTTGAGAEINSTQDFSVGWSFTTTQQSTVIALDALDPTGPNGESVRLYDGLGNLIASATVTTGDPQDGSPLFYSHSIVPVTLAGNTTYYIAQDLPAGTHAWFQVDTPTTGPEITYGAPVGDLGLGLDPITDLALGQTLPAYFGPNFNLAIPEPAGVLAMAAALIALAFVPRRPTAPVVPTCRD